MKQAKQHAQAASSYPKAPKRILTSDPALPHPANLLTTEQNDTLKAYQITEQTLTDKQRLQVLAVLQRHEVVLARKKMELGACNLGQHHIDTGTAAPIFCNPHRMPYSH